MAAFPLAALVQAGGSIISGLMQKKPKTYTPAQQIESTVQGARKAGIHPLAALGASPGYTTVSGGATAGSAIGAGMESLGRSMASQLPKAQLDQIAASTDAQRAQAELFRAQSRTLLSKTANAAVGGPRVDGDKLPPTLKVFGHDVKRKHKLFSSAQDVSDEYGDLIEALVGIPSFGSAISSNVDRFLEKKGLTDRQLIDSAKRAAKKVYRYRFNNGRYMR